MTTTAQIAAKGCKSTGITEEMAESLHNQLGKTLVAVVELRAEGRTEKLNGDEKVSLSILTIEPAPNRDTEDHLRELARAFHYERKLAESGPTLPGTEDDGPAPKVVDVLAAGKSHEPHQYLDTVDAVCDACDQPAGAAIHSVPADQDEEADDTTDPGESEGLADLDDEPEDEETDEQPPAAQHTNPFEVVSG